ncbi:MAG: EamA family transporter [Phycisphaerales bacterium]|nr:EamA family transporter [Phycisphaerales bacterium]
MKPILLAIAAGLCWGIGEACTRSVLHEGRVGPMTALLIRALVALPVIVLAWWLMLKGVGGLHPEPSIREMDVASWIKVIVGSGLLAGAIGIIFFYVALSVGDLSVVKPIAFALAPLVAVLLGWLVLGESMDLRKTVAVVLIVAGVVLLSVQPASVTPMVESPTGSS